MLRMFYNSFQVFLAIFVSVLDVCFKCFIRPQAYVLTVASEYFKSRSDVLDFPPRFLLPRLGVSSSSRHRLGIRRPLPHFSILVTFGAALAPCGRVKRREK
jgi:hypothetical protein